jgi:hypothetical protein
MRWLWFALVVLGGLQAVEAQEAHEPGHSEQVYGKRLAYHKVEGVGPCIDAEVVGDRLYAIGQGSLYVMDIRTPQTPKLLGKLDGLGTTRQLVLKDQIAYVTARQDGLWMIDVSNPARPTLLSHYDTVEMATGIWVSGNVGFIATRLYGVEIVDVSDPRHVRHVSALKTGEAQSCWARDGLLYIGDWAPRKLLVADVSDPRQPKLVGEGLMDGFGDGGCLRGKYCFAATGHHSRTANKEEGYGKGHGLEIFDVSQPTRPAFVSRVKFPAFYGIFRDMWSARVAGDYCVVADTHNGLFVLNIRDVAKPAIVAHAQLPYVPTSKWFDPVGGVALAEDVIYAAGVDTGLYVVPAPGMASPVVPEPDRAPVLSPLPSTPAPDPDFLVYRPEGQVHSATVQGDVAWVACGSDGLQAVKLGEKLERVGRWTGQGDVCHVSVCGRRLYTAESAGGMGIYEIGPGPQLKEVGRLKMPGQGVKQVVAPAPGRFAMLHCGGSRLSIIDVSDPAKPVVVLSDNQIGLFYGDQLADALVGGRYLVARWHRGGPSWYDVAGEKPVRASYDPESKFFTWNDAGCAWKDKLLISARGKYAVLEANDRRPTSELPRYGVAGVTINGRSSVSGSLLAVSQRMDREVQVFDITDITRPKLERQYTLFGHPGACAFWNGRVVIPAGYQGLLVTRAAFGQPAKP